MADVNLVLQVGSESAAVAYAQQANASAQASAASAESASESATAASGSATQAANSASAAAGSAAQASGYATNAGESASAAAQSAAAAETAKANAGNSATAAASSASAATTKAGEASSSASSAASSATSAAGSATSAASSATSANGSASSASTSASNAATSATQAENAKTDAESAKTDAEEARDQAQEYAESIDPDTLAKIDGYYEDLTSGNAEQLLSDVYTDNSEPYLFRKTGGDGKREYLDKIVGGSLVWNQLCNSASVTVTSGHKYYMKKSGTASIGASTGSAITGLTSGTDMVIDLTSEFGSMIADYVYSLETATAGAGVAWLRQYIDIDSYHPYSALTLKHVEGLVSHDTVGFNLFDEELEAAQWRNVIPGTTAYKTESSLAICCKNPIPVLPNSTYFFWCSKYPTLGTAYADVVLLDKDKKYIGYFPAGGNLGRNTKFVVTTAETRYIVFNLFRSYGMVYTNDICINLSWSGYRNGEYEPYQKHSYPLDPSVVLRGVPMLVDGRLKYDGDEYAYDGTVNRRYGIVDLGTMTWSLNGESETLQDWRSGSIVSTVKAVEANTVPHIICAKFITMSRTGMANAINAIGVTASGNIGISVPSGAYADAAAFKTAMSGVYLVYELATPTTETAEPFRQLQICDTYGTEEFVTTSEVPVGTETRYPEDLKSKIEGLPWDLSMIAPIEDGTTASKAYTTGQYFLHNNVFCKALTSIASGATFTLNTNYSETTVAAELYAALH